MRVGIALIALVLILGTLQFCSWQRARQQAVQSKVDRGQAGAARESAEDAIATQGNVAANASASEDLTRSNEREIRNAKGADQSVDAGVRDAGLASLCRRPAYRNHERCRVQQLNPR